MGRSPHLLLFTLLVVSRDWRTQTDERSLPQQPVDALMPGVTAEEFKTMLSTGVGRPVGDLQQQLTQVQADQAAAHNEAMRTINSMRTESQQQQAAGSSSSTTARPRVPELRKTFDSSTFSLHLPSSVEAYIDLTDITTCAKGAVSKHLYAFVGNLVMRDFARSVGPSDNRMLCHLVNYAVVQQKGASASPPKSHPPRCRSALPSHHICTLMRNPSTA